MMAQALNPCAPNSGSRHLVEAEAEAQGRTGVAEMAVLCLYMVSLIVLSALWKCGFGL